ncbi:MAG: serine/threonine protein kinase [Chloroflexota bacterium]|nr:serine/threonine protein kinase [Chloroflexota bacterium]
MLNLEGRELGGCRLLRVVGEGGMGKVYLAEQLNAGNRAVAVKVVRPDTLSSQAEDVEDIRERFKREVALAANFNNPNILPVYYSGAEDDYLYIVMLYAEEGSLSDAVRGRSRRKLSLPLDLAMTADIVTQVASALQYIHDRGVVHRDVKPGNVLINIEQDGHWRMMLADFGVARGPDSTTARTQVAGTFTYMAPEQFEGKFSPATDQYALAVMTYQLLAGRPPFEGELGSLTRAHMYDTPPPLQQFNGQIPPAVEQVIMRALKKDPTERYGSVTAYAKALAAAAKPGAAPEPQEAPIMPPDPRVTLEDATTPAPQWPGGPDARKSGQGGLSRLWLAALAAVVLLVAVIGVGDYVNIQRTQAEQSAIKIAQANAALTQTAQVTVTTAPATSPTTTVTVTPSGPTPTTAPNVLPPGVGAAVFTNAAPTCDGASTPVWSKDGVTPTCVGATQVSLVAAKASTLACLSAQGVSQPNGYAQTTVDPQTGKAEIGVRQGVGTTSGSTFTIKGYYLAIDTSTSHYLMYAVDAAGKVTVLQDAPLNGAPPHPFTFGLLFNGTSLTPYVNGQAYPSVTDSTFTNGWTAICTDGSGSFSNVGLYNLAS